MNKYLLNSIFFYPVLFAANMVLTILASNQIIVPISDAVLPTLVISVLACGLLIGFKVRIKDWHRTSYLVLLVAICAQYYGVMINLVAAKLQIHIDRNLHFSVLIIWTIVFYFLASNWLWRKIVSPKTITTYFASLTLVIVSFSLVKIWSYNQANWLSLDNLEFNRTIPKLHGSQKPDIYYIILDEYGRSDIFLDLYGIDNKEFIDFLEGKGFYVAHKSRSNYILTGLSLPSSLNMDYLPVQSPESRDQRLMLDLIQNSRVRSALESFGYESVALASPYEPSNVTGSDIYINKYSKEKSRILKNLLLTNSIFLFAVDNGIVDLSLPRYRDQQELIINNFNSLADIAKMPGPQFVFMHVILPHPPFIFDRNGPVTPNEIYYLLSGIPTFDRTLIEWMSAYEGQLIYLNHLLIKAVDEILENSSEPPIIIFQGDHGPRTFRTEDSKSTCLKDRTSILNAIYLPSGTDKGLYPTITPVNTFRYIFKTFFEADVELISDRTYYSNIIKPFDLLDITDIIDSQACQMSSNDN